MKGQQSGNGTVACQPLSGAFEKHLIWFLIVDPAVGLFLRQAEGRSTCIDVADVFFAGKQNEKIKAW